MPDESRQLARSLGLTAASVILPGVAHAVAGRRRTAFLLLTAYFLLIATAVLGYLAIGNRGLLGLGLDTRVLRLVTLGAAALAVLWPITVVSSYLVNRPRLSTAQQVLAGFVVLILCALTSLPFLVAASYANIGRRRSSRRSASRPAGSVAQPMRPRSPTAPGSTCCCSAATVATVGRASGPTR
ncbi:MAG: hypothetical protein L0Y54_14550 [Sporichthyaceae bacterium]|nr:hypothetical protein [Sporichthyaceae bacterium]